MYKYEAKPPPNNKLFNILHRSQTENISEHKYIPIRAIETYID
jgi:hypothetical protein